MAINLFGLRRRGGCIVMAMALSFACCGCGSLLTFVLAPRQALKAAQVSSIPQMDLVDVQAAAPGTPVLITGTLSGNDPALPDGGLVAYVEETWEVNETRSGRQTKTKAVGHWQKAGTVVPDLTLTFGEQSIGLLAADHVALSGRLHEVIVDGTGPFEADDAGIPRPAGTQRFRGLKDGDRTTVLGQKSSDGGIIPEALYAGDRVAFEASQHQATSGLFVAGVTTLFFSPLVFFVGLGFAVFGRRV